MSEENKKPGLSNMLVASIILVVGVAFTGIAVVSLGGGQKLDGTSLDDVIDLADAAQSAETIAGVQGAAIDAAPEAAPADAAAVDGLPPKIRSISDESKQLLEQADAASANSDDPFKFDKTKDGMHYKVSFKSLGGYAYEVPDPNVIRAQPDPSQSPVDQVPGGIKALNESPVLIAGFMVPIEFNAEGKVSSFALTQDQMFCCYGVPPKMNEWVMVTMADGFSTEYRNDAPVAVFGQLNVGEEIDDGYVLSLYRLKSDKVIDVRELLKETQG
ncbi:MAG: DUF3299 domain-containing protein [Candidatus Hydrogenedens sp.]|nr:DUF3299 domain-containing protein [Candidatus Hydrogenedens sp.]